MTHSLVPEDLLERPQVVRHALRDAATQTLARHCSHPVQVPSVGCWVRCGSRDASYCPSCAALVAGDWAAIARSGCLPSDDVPAEVLAGYRVFFVTLTAPSFGHVHRVPKGEDSPRVKCGCGRWHPAGSPWAGVPLDPANYNYTGAVAWNNGVGALWHSSAVRLRQVVPDVEWFGVKELQKRGALHLHCIVRVPAWANVDSLDPTTGRTVRGGLLLDTLRSCTADDSRMRWGTQGDVQPVGNGALTSDDAARTIWYITKTLNYMEKDWATVPDASGRPLPEAEEHCDRLALAAAGMRCANCARVGWSHCRSGAHKHWGNASSLVLASRGWSLTGLTRTQCAITRRNYALRGLLDACPEMLDTWVLVEHIGRLVNRETGELRTVPPVVLTHPTITVHDVLGPDGVLVPDLVVGLPLSVGERAAQEMAQSHIGEVEEAAQLLHVLDGIEAPDPGPWPTALDPRPWEGLSVSGRW